MAIDLLLATILAVAPENAAKPAPVATVAKPKRGWIGVGGRNSFGPPTRRDPEFGLELMGGRWLAREHLMPVMRLGWSRGSGDGLRVDTMRFGGTLAAGGALAGGRLWLGAGPGFVARKTWTLTPTGIRAGHGGSLTLSAFVLGRFWGRMLLGVEFGPELSLPLERIDGRRVAVVRFNAGLRIGVIFGSPIARKQSKR
jgi:hypothetical protein